MQYFVMYCAGANSLTALTFDMFEHGQYIKFLLPLLDKNILEATYLFIATENRNHIGKHINRISNAIENKVLVNTISLVFSVPMKDRLLLRCFYPGEEVRI